MSSKLQSLVYVKYDLLQSWGIPINNVIKSLSFSSNIKKKEPFDFLMKRQTCMYMYTTYLIYLQVECRKKSLETSTYYI
ncbi:hypothetical protein BD770DRAFT_387645 [Pilaira anomala]|nr:hypothetical protein BD770DRAFT_387645 [Pilaira anomala]